MKQTAWAFALVFFAGAAFAQSKEEKLQQLRKALRGDGGTQGDTPRRPPPTSAPVDMRLRALDELKQKDDSYSSEAGPSIGVVKTQNILAEDPVYYTGLQLGVTAQPYQPMGEAPLVTLGRRDLSQYESTWMFGIEARYMPWVSSLAGEHGVGFRLGGAYTKQAIELRAPTGVRLGNSALHALQTYATFSQEWILPSDKRWSLNADVGLMRFDMLLTSASSVGETSDNIFLGLVRLGPAFRLGDFSFNVNYERRQRLSNGWARLEDNAFTLGLLYGIR